ncbi:GtrA family protein [Pseudoclavibacter endophyticus]|uniref:GtrA family protein n=2 Tax=Pseudoclavibacter endophyticus TaxID=1778590 RepID=A0A6H9WHN4_9MICO|nr:GtrA family protein [Pseudoclavibacter endophyticus]
MRLVRQLGKFGLVGGVGFVIDISLYNVLVLTVLAPASIAVGPLLAKTVSTLVAITTNWIGNRLWTFRQHRRRGDSAREGAEFFAVSLAGLVIGLVPLWVSHYLLGWNSLLADNIANVIGLGIGSIFRFALYRFWVFSPSRRRSRESPGDRRSGYPQESRRATRPDSPRVGS